MAYGKFWIDVAANAYWEAGVPLEVLAKNIQKTGLEYERSLDFFQINFGYDGEYTIENAEYNFSNAELKAYISFQPVTGPQQLFRDLSSVKLPQNRVVDASENFAGKAYEVINGTVVIPPAPEGYQVVVYFIANAKSVIRSPMLIKSLSFASVASDTHQSIKSAHFMVCPSHQKIGLPLQKKTCPISISRKTAASNLLTEL